MALTVAPPSSAAPASDLTKFDAAAKVMDTGKAAEADVFAPKAWAKATERITMAKAVLSQGGRQTEGDKIAVEAGEYAENAIKAAEVCKLSLKQYLDARNRARAAHAPTLVPEMYMLAEQKFIEATGKVEGGDVKGGLKKAAETSPLFDTAEDGAIRVELLGKADKLIATAVADEAVQYAPSTLDAARAARKAAADILTKDRYNRTAAVREAARAEYEARHASNIAMSVRSLNRNDQAWEKLMLLYEIQMNRIGKATGWEYLPFDNGPIAAADSVLAGVARMQGERARLQGEAARLEGEGARAQGEHAATSAALSGQMEQFRGDVNRQLQGLFAQLSATPTEVEPLQLITQLSSHITALLADRKLMADKLAASEARAAELQAAGQQATAALEARKAKEDRLAKARQMLNPSEGEVIVNSTGDVVLRLSGLSFDAGKAVIKDQHVPLLQKVQGILQLYADASYVIEGHTDATGDGTANQQLSEKRAFALMQYLRQGMSIPPDRIRAIGYGSERPIAPSTTVAGKAKNRRIDILILQ